jgi:hypothetical protein
MPSVNNLFQDIGDAWQRDIIDLHKQPQVVLLVAFLGTFGIVRFITHSIRDQRFTKIFHNMSAGGTHLHHLVPGIILMILSGYLLVALPQPEFPKEPLAFFFGVGMALTLDEFALWLHLKDNYWSKQGRQSVDAVIVVATILGLGVLGLNFWIELGRILFRSF